MHSNLPPLLSILVLMIGVVALLITPREENPQINVPAANVMVRMAGASPEEVQNLIVRPLEQVMHGMTGVDHTYGIARDSMGIVTVTFKVGQDNEKSLVKLYDHLMHNLDRIPPGASQPLVKPLNVDDVPVSVITLSSPNMDGLMLKRLAERVRDQLAPLQGVSVVNIIGGRNRTVRITLDPARLAAWKIPLDHLHQVLMAANRGGAVGDLVGNNRVQRVWLDGFLKNSAQVGQLVVGETNGQPIYLRDVATIRDGAAELTALHRIGFGLAAAGKPKNSEPETPAVSITLAKKLGTNAVVVTDRIAKKLAQLKGELIPDNVTVTITRDSGKRANAAVNVLIEHLAIAIASVIVIMLLFLGWREAAIVTMNIPLILFIVLAIGLLADQTINRITLFSLILSLGLLVDDAIVVIENIHRHLHHGVRSLSEKASAIIAATNETGKPTIVATIAVILAFIPMAFVTGMMGPYMGPIPFNVPVAMAASLIVAYILTPWIAQRWLPCKIHQSTMEELDATPKDWIHRSYLRLATPLIERVWTRRLFGLIVLALFAAAMWEPIWQFVRPQGINGPHTPGTVELKMLPKGNQNTFNITIDMPEGTPLEATDAIARQIGDLLRSHPQVTNYETFVGQAGPIDFNGMLRGAVLRHGANLAEIRVNLVNKHDRAEHSDAIVLDIRHLLKPLLAAHPDANIKLNEDPPGPPVHATLLAEIYGPHEAGRRAIAVKVRQLFAHTWDVTDVDDSIAATPREWRIQIDKARAARLGVATSQVERALTDYLQGFSIGTIHLKHARHPVAITVRLPRNQRLHPEDLQRIYISGSQGPVQLATIATVIKARVLRPRMSKDGHPVVFVSGEPATESQVYPLLTMDHKLDGKTLIAGAVLKTGGLRFTSSMPDDTFGYHLLWNGEMRLTLDVFRDLGAAFIVGLLLIYLLLVGYYGTFLLPILVMAPTALTLIGIFPGHWITGQPFTATSMIGMIALAGIVVRNSILLIDFILDYRKRGHPLKDAVLEAGAIRARPILLTALAVIAGSAVMISDPVFGGLGVSMAFGTLAATVLTLFIIPLIYYLWQRKAETT
ncbi:MAG: efflux RND transporter permease subunit [Mariprofundales bacterium]|nr:efflux RND transporter permease subunit [Mariprofundales bacterium]